MGIKHEIKMFTTPVPAQCINGLRNVKREFDSFKGSEIKSVFLYSLVQYPSCRNALFSRCYYRHIELGLASDSYTY